MRQSLAIDHMISASSVTLNLIIESKSASNHSPDHMDLFDLPVNACTDQLGWV